MVPETGWTVEVGITLPLEQYHAQFPFRCLFVTVKNVYFPLSARVAVTRPLDA